MPAAPFPVRVSVSFGVCACVSVAGSHFVVSLDFLVGLYGRAFTHTHTHTRATTASSKRTCATSGENCSASCPLAICNLQPSGHAKGARGKIEVAIHTYKWK